MSYILNLNLPLWWMFLPLIIAFIPTAKWSKWKAKYYTAQYKAENNALQLIRDFERHKAESEKYQAEIKALKFDAAEREALIENLDRKVLELTDSLTFSDRLVKLGDAIEKQLLDNVEQLESKLELSELAHNETNHDYQTLRGRVSVLTLLNEDLKADLVAAIAVINRTGRGRKQWAKIQAVKQAFESNKTSSEIEAVTHDALGVARVFQPDQSESVNNRHIKELGSEVVRGIQEQNNAIEKELQADGVDMSTLEVGDSVKLRSGDIEVVRDIVKKGDDEQPYWVFTKNSDWYYSIKGELEIGKKWEWDIVQIIKPAKFDPQIGELVKLVDYPNEVFVIEHAKNGGFNVQNVTYKWHQWRKVQDMRPVIGKTYQNGHKKDSNTCYKEPDKTCIYDCGGLCKNS